MAVSASTGVMNSLLGKLTTLMGDEYRKLKGVRNKVVSLHEEFSSMNALLVKLAGMDELDVQAKVWRDQVREMSYDIEDCIDDFMHDLEVKGATTGFLKKTAERFKKLKVRHQIANKINGIEARVLQLHERRIRYKLDEYNPTTSIVHIDPRALAIFADAAGLVGINTPRDELIELLMDQGQELKVASIVGFGGLGKTTLANEVCREIKGKFTCHAFVSVSLKPDIPRLLRNLLLKLTREQLSPSSSLDDVITNIREYLLNERYFIIIDDLWDTLAWDIIKCAFPENNHGSRVLTTTRIYSVAAACCSKSRGCVFKMKYLNEHDSRRMFFSRIFGSENSCPTELVDVSMDILKKCGGLPLAIISISSLLADQPKTTFEYVRKSLGCMFDGNPTLDQMRQILELSFRNLPNHLKTCLLYLGMYPEDHVIWTFYLLRQWIAEVFVRPTPGLDAEDVAISYFNELINRSMIQPVDTDDGGEVLSCRVHDIMLDVIRSKIEEENFISVLSDPDAVLGMHRNIRRASFQCSGEECRLTSAMVNGSLSKVRSVYAFGGFSCQSVMLLKYIRVLHLDMGFARNNVLDLTGISKLFLLRCLNVVGDTRIELPSQIGELQQLETLDLAVPVSVSNLPSDIVSLPLLLHLSVYGHRGFPDGIGRLRLLRTLRMFGLERNSVENIKGLGEMTSLRYFTFQWSGNDLVEGARRMDVLRSSLQRISGSLRILQFHPGNLDSEGLDGWTTFSPPPIHLRDMMMSGCVFSMIPKWFGHLRDLQSLRFTVRAAGLKDDGVAILAGLPSLVFLQLGSEKPLEERVRIPGSGIAFRALKEFFLCCWAPLLTFEAGAMPVLKKLFLLLIPSRCESGGSVEGPLDGIEHLPAGLREIDIRIKGERDEDGEALKSSLKIAFEEHHPGAALDIRCR
ncbi:disease resistance protein RGA5-like [Lolium rigidum]|uniref:disease resistance protein RGA5-like n=1 Tax=Lolium rigidum TaxID=89674 RepID=UPI001F5C85B1|nr:disease resistance protein RGA5-like [Lolium rigidum]XP_051182638.1 disease resistance protein RGA5-like [Lolium perenne]XP_051182639.1 disease resistance protein RGA5-like [Lolium perenne]